MISINLGADDTHETTDVENVVAKVKRGANKKYFLDAETLIRMIIE